MDPSHSGPHGHCHRRAICLMEEAMRRCLILHASSEAVEAVEAVRG